MTSTPCLSVWIIPHHHHHLLEQDCPKTFLANVVLCTMPQLPQRLSVFEQEGTTDNLFIFAEQPGIHDG